MKKLSFTYVTVYANLMNFNFNPSKNINFESYNQKYFFFLPTQCDIIVR